MLTDAAVKSAKPGTKTKRLFDTLGLYLEVSPAGGKWWRLKYRVDGKEKRLSLGVYPEVGLKEARERRDKARGKLRDGIDPAGERKAKRTADDGTFKAVALEWHGRQTWGAKYEAITKRRLERDVFPWIGAKPIAKLTPPDILAVLRRIEERGALETASRILGILGQVFRYAVATSRAKRDITPDLRGALKPAVPVHFAATTDPKRLGAILRALDGYEGSLVVRCALRLAPLVFVRPGELRGARWADIDLEAAEWRYLVTKTGTPHIVPLSRQAVAILRELHPLTGKGEFVFPGGRTKARTISENTVNGAMRRLDIGQDEMTGHGWRAVARTILDEVLGFRPDWIEHQLAHAVRDPNGRAYNRTAHLAERRRMMQEWADWLDGVRG